MMIFFGFMHCAIDQCSDVSGKRTASVFRVTAVYAHDEVLKKGISVPLQAWSGPERSRKLRFPDFMTTAQIVVRLSALRTGRLYPQEIHLVLISVRG